MSLDNFDWEKYIENYEDLRNAGVDTKEKAWDHWISYGQYEGRICFNLIESQNFDFDWENYINRYDDLKVAGINTKEKAWMHWIKYGQFENRKYSKIIDLNNFINIVGYSIFNNPVKDGLNIVFQNFKSINCVNLMSNSTINLIAGEIDKFYSLLKPNDFNGVFTMIEEKYVKQNWVDLINKYCSVTFVPSLSLKNIFINSGIKNEVIYVPMSSSQLNNKKIIKFENKSEYVVGLLGVPADRKNFKKAVEACKAVNLKVHLHISYFHTTEQENEWTNIKNNFDNLILTTGNIENIDSWWDKIDIYLFPSSGGGFSKTPREALSYGKVCIISDIIAHNDIILSNSVKTIPVYDTNDFRPEVKTSDIIDALYDVINNFNYYQNLAYEGYKWINNLEVSYNSTPIDATSYLSVKNYLLNNKSNNALIYFPYCVSDNTRHGSQSTILEFILNLKSKKYNIKIISQMYEDQPEIMWKQSDFKYWDKHNIEVLILDKNHNIHNINYKNYNFFNNNNFLYFAYNPNDSLYEFHKNMCSRSLLSIGKIYDIDGISSYYISNIISNNWLKLNYDYACIENTNKLIDNVEKNIDNFYFFKILNSFNIFTSLSRFEQNLMFKKFNKPTLYVPICLKINNLNFGNKIIIVASSNPFNRLGIKYFINNILPDLSENIKIHIYGGISYCEEIVNINDNRLINCGTFDNIENVYDNCRFSICITLLGTGNKTKITESLSYGVPVLAYTKEAKNSLAQHNVNSLIFENSNEYINYIKKMATDDNLIERLRSNCINTAKDNKIIYDQNINVFKI